MFYIWIYDDYLFVLDFEQNFGPSSRIRRHDITIYGFGYVAICISFLFNFLVIIHTTFSSHKILVLRGVWEGRIWVWQYLTAFSFRIRTDFWQTNRKIFPKIFSKKFRFLSNHSNNSVWILTEIGIRIGFFWRQSVWILYEFGRNYS